MVGDMTPAVLRKHINLLYASHNLDDAPRARAAAEALQGIDAHWQYRPLLTAIRDWLSWRVYGAALAVKVRDSDLGGERSTEDAAALLTDYYAELARRQALVVDVRDLVSSGLRRDVDQAAALVADYSREAAA